MSNVVAMKLELPSTPVQELVKSNTGKQIPDRYVFNPKTNTSESSNFDDNDDSVVPWMESPVIDFQQLLLDSQHEMHKLRSVLTSWGCFQLINHGTVSSKIDQLRQVSKEFFALPLEQKQKYSRTVDWFEGYGNDTVSEGQPFNWNDRLHLKIYPVDQRNVKLWPEIPSKFRETLDAYAVEVRKLLENMLKVIAKSLNLEEESFYNQFGEEEGIMFSRFNYYPPCPSPDQVFGLKPHSDVTLITILLQDTEVHGLQVLKDDQWFKVPIVPDAFFINVGDQLEIMSNGILKSVVHKVVIDKQRERMSVAVASSPPPDKEIGPVSELIDEERPQLYKNVKNYLATFLQYIARSERAIDAMKI